MDKSIILTLLEKYWQAETTIAEEQALAAYFKGDRVDPELEAYAGLFAYFQEEARVTAGPDFGDRILQRLGLPADAASDGRDTAAVPVEAPVPVVPMVRRPFTLGVVAAAAAIIVVVASLFLLTPAGGPPMLATAPTAGRPGQVTDTYEDPQQALAAVRHALLIASNHLNEGRRELTGAHK